MQHRLIFLLKTLGFWLILFFFARLIFECYNFTNTRELNFTEIILTFLHGFRLDLSISSYFMFVYGLIVATSVFVKAKYLLRTVKLYTYFLVFATLFIIIVDVELFRNWGFRMDTTPLQYLNTPLIALASTPLWATISFVTFWILIALLACRLYVRFVSRDFAKFEKIKWHYFPVFIFATAFFALPARGTLTEWPIRVSTVAFSTKQYANHASLNVVWNFINALTKKSGAKEHVHVVPDAVANKVFDSLKASQDSTLILLNTNKPNVVVLILESFSSDAIEFFGGKPGITPCLNKLAEEGVSFTNFYAASYRSNVGLIAILAGYPAQHHEAILLFPNKVQKLTSLAKSFCNDNYSTAFYYGGDSDFANMNSFIKSGGYNKLEDLFFFPKTLPHNSWGVHDHVMFDHLINEMDNEKGSFYKVLYTLSSHEPFEVPGEPIIKGSDEDSQFLNTVAYSDKSLGHFFDVAKTKPWWKNTLFIITADHSVRFINNRPMELPRRYSIPMVWLGGALQKDHLKITKIGSQQDIPATLLAQVGKDSHAFKFSNNILNVKAKGRAFYVWPSGYGLKDENGTVAYSVDESRLLNAEGDTTNLTLQAKSIFQVSVNDFDNKEFDKAQ